MQEIKNGIDRTHLNTLQNDSKKIQYIDKFAAVVKNNATLYSKYADKKNNELIQSVSLLYWNIANLYREHGMLIEGEKYMRERLRLFESAGIVNIDYADAIIGLANWMDIYNHDYIATLEWHKKHVEVVAAICNNRDDPQLQIAIKEMAGCYGARFVRTELDYYVNNDASYDDILPIIKVWKSILADLYRQLGQSYVDKILENYSNSIIKEYHIEGRDRYWHSNTLNSSIMSEITYYIRNHDLTSAENAILELKNTIDRYNLKNLHISAAINVAILYMESSYNIRAKDIFFDLYTYMTSDDTISQNHQDDIEFCGSCLANIAGVRLGDMEMAYKVLLQRRRLYGSNEQEIRESYMDIHNYINDMRTLCSLEQKMYNFDQALSYIESAHEAFIEYKHKLSTPIRIIEEQSILAQEGDILRSLGNYEAAEKILNQSISLYNDNSDLASNIWPVDSYMNLANLYYDKHDYESAKIILLKILKYYEQSYSERVVGPASYLMDIYLKEHNYMEARKYFSYTWENTRNYIQEQFISMTKGERSIFWGQEWGTQEIYGGIALSAQSFFDADYYDIVLFCKGLLLRAERDISEFVRKSDIPKLKIAYQRFIDATKTKERDKDIYEKELMYLLSLLAHQNFSDVVTWNDIKLKLKTKDVSIEFVECWQQDNKTYAALILRKDWDRPQMIPLCTKEELEQISSINLEDEKWRKNSFARKDLDKRYFKKGYSLIWSKLEPYINEGDNVYFSPSGLLHQINVEVLRDSTGLQANEKYNLYRVSSTRQLCIKKPKIKYTNATLYGGLIYEMDSTQMIAQSRTYHSTDNYVASRGFVADSTTRVGWKYLSATKSEVEMIARQMHDHRIRPKRYTETAGTEESFKALSGRHIPIIHLATHGFFLKDEEAQMQDYFQAFDLEQYRNVEDNSMKRSGLILAGGQRAWLNEPIPANVEDGILLAEEIATMDLSGTDLVVLSACQTGLGEITSEGVFGLQRAFKKAGVQTLIMSLWRVNDEATSLMMQTFYEQLLSGQSKREAFALAQQAVKEKFIDPYYWAAFIMLD